MTEEVVVARAEDVPPGTGRVVPAGDRMLAVFNVDGEFHAIDNTCLHRGGPLGEGDLEEGVVTCPWHGWQYDVTTGHNLANPNVGVRHYEVRVEDGEIRVKL